MNPALLQKRSNSFRTDSEIKDHEGIFFIEKISFSLKLFSGHFYGQSFIKTVRGPFM